MEAEDVIVGAGQWLARRLGWFDRPAPPDLHRLAAHKTRLEHLLLAVCGREIAVRAANPPMAPTLLARLFARRPPPSAALPGTDGHGVFLPPELHAPDAEQAMRRWRLSALRQAWRMQRGAAALAGLEEPWRSAVALNEIANVDLELSRRLPGLREELAQLRRERLARLEADAAGPWPDAYRRLLAAPADTIAAPWSATADAAASLAALRALAAPPLTQPLPDDDFIGLVLPPSAGGATVPESRPEAAPPERTRTAELPRRPDVRQADEDEDDAQPGPWMIQSSDPIEQAEDPFGLQRPGDRDDAADPDELGDSLSELRQARLVSTPDPAKEILLSELPDAARARRASGAGEAEACLRYPEWDYRRGDYIDGRASVFLRPLLEFDRGWLGRTRERQRPLILRVKQQFAALKPRRVVRKRLTEGEEIDIDACVEAVAGRRCDPRDDLRVYAHARPRQPDTAVALLLDASASTDAWLHDDRRVIDVEKEALLVLRHALNELGGPYAIYAFSGDGPERVDLYTVKAFEETAGEATDLKISALQPQRYTRLGAALRHAGAQLAQQPARQRLLLVLTDGRPNDCDEYEGRYGVEDVRMAVGEAAARGLIPFCLTIDRGAPAYLPQMFGAHRYALLPRAETLPRALAELLRRLMRD